MKNKLTDYQKIALALKKHKSLTTLHAAIHVGTTKLPTRIGELEYAYKIEFKRIWEENETTKKKYIRYSLTVSQLKELFKLLKLKY